MNVSCPECQSVFRVDPAKIPPTGVRARCSVCGGVITVGIGPSVDEEFAPSRASAAAARASRGIPAMGARVRAADGSVLRDGDRLGRGAGTPDASAVAAPFRHRLCQLRASRRRHAAGCSAATRQPQRHQRRLRSECRTPPPRRRRRRRCARRRSRPFVRRRSRRRPRCGDASSSGCCRSRRRRRLRRRVPRSSRRDPRRRRRRSAVP